MNKQNLAKRAAVALLLAFFGVLQGVAATYYTQATATVIGGEGGTVYVGTTNATPADDAFQTTVVSLNSTTSRSAHKHYFFAKAAEGYEFVGWYTSATPAATAKPTSTNATAWSVSLTPGSSATSEANATKTTRYAKFVKKQTYFSVMNVNANDGGKVFASTTATENRAWAAQVALTQNSEASSAPSHNYYLYAQGAEGYDFLGWSTTPTGAIVSTANPYTAAVTATADSEAPGTATYYAQFATAVPHYSKVKLMLNGNNDISNLGTTMIGGKVYVGTTAEEAASCTYELTSELVQNSMSVNPASHEYYLYAKADEGFEFAGFGTGATASTSFINTSSPYSATAPGNPYKVTVSATSTDEAAPTEKIYYASFKYAADNKPTVCYGNFTVVTMLAEDDGTGKYVNVESDEPALIGINYNADASGKGAVTTEPTWHAGSSYASEAISKPYTSGTVYFPYTIFVKPNPGYEFVGWTSTSSTTNPSQKGTPVEDYNYYYSDSYTRTSVSNVNYPGSCGVEGAPKTKRYYAVFKKLEQMDEPTGTTPVQVTEVKGTTTLAEGEVTKDFTVDLVLNEQVPYDKPGSDKNAKPVEVLKQFVTVTGANGNKATVTNYSLVYESKDLGEDSNGMSLGTGYTCNTLRLSFPYNIKADTYTVHLPYGLYTTKAGNKTPTYEFTITVTEAASTSLTVKSVFPTEGLTIKYKAPTQTGTEPDPEKGEFEKSNITASVTFNEVVESIDETKIDGIVLQNSTVGVNYKPTNVFRNAAIFGKVSGEVSIAYPELVNGSYSLTIPAGLFVGSSKTNEEIKVNFTVTGFNSVQLKPYELVLDHVSPKSGDMTQSVERLSEITITYKEPAVALLGDASKITVKGYTEVIKIKDDGEGATSERTYYDVAPAVSAKVAEGKLVVSFAPALATGMYEVNIPAAFVANMEAGDMTMAQKVNAGYAESAAHSNLTFKVESADVEIPVSAAKYATFYDSSLAYKVGNDVTAYIFSKSEGKIVPIMDGIIPANTGVVLKAAEGNHTLTAVNSTAVYSENLLLGTDEATQLPADESKKFYALSLNAQGDLNSVGFYWMNPTGAAFVNAAHKAYLVIEGAEAVAKAKAAYLFEDDATGIKDIQNAESVMRNYNLNGVRVNESYKGIVIKNGKKVIVK